MMHNDGWLCFIKWLRSWRKTTLAPVSQSTSTLYWRNFKFMIMPHIKKQLDNDFFVAPISSLVDQCDLTHRLLLSILFQAMMLIERIGLATFERLEVWCNPCRGSCSSCTNNIDIESQWTFWLHNYLKFLQFMNNWISFQFLIRSWFFKKFLWFVQRCLIPQRENSMRVS